MRHTALAVLLCASTILRGEIATPPPEKTTVSATLDVPHRPGQNLVWCSTFQLAWNAMGQEQAKETLRLEGTPALERALNASTVNVREVDAPSVYVKTGVVGQALIDEINAELKKRFGDNAPPPVKLPQTKLPGILAYSYLFKQLSFATPLDRQTSPLEWHGDEDAKALLQSFGLAVKPGGANIAAAKQVVILQDKPGEYIIELKTKTETDRMILAQAVPGATLKDTVAAVQKKVAKPARMPFTLEITDRLSVPCVELAVERAYDEIVGKKILNEKLKEHWIDDARQNIRFSLDEKGAKVKSEAEILALKNGHQPRVIVFDRPFLLYIQRVRAENPYFAIWFENTKLFVKGEGEPAKPVDPKK